jgi:HK97 family phage major capsid protein
MTMNSSAKILKLTEERNSKLSEAISLNQAGIRNAEQKRKYQSLTNTVDDIDDQIADLRKLDAMMTRAGITESTVLAEPVREVAPIIANMTKEQRYSHVNEAFRKYLLGDSKELRAVTDPGTSFDLVPQKTFDTLRYVARYHAPILDLIQIEENQSGRPTQFVHTDPTSSFLAATAEGSAASDISGSFNFGDTILDHDSFSGLVRFSPQMLESSQKFDLLDVIQKLAGVAVANTVESAIFKGTDPAGATLSNQANVIANATVATTSTAVADGIGEGDLAALVEGQSPQLWPVSKFAMNGNTYLALLQQKTSTGERFWPELGQGKLWAWDVVIVNSLPSVAANSIPVLFGDWSAVGASHVGLRLQLLQERFLIDDAGLIRKAALLSTRLASNLMDVTAIQALKIGS